MRREDLAHFTGTSRYYQHWSGLVYTDGIQHVAEKGEAYWLIDAVASYQVLPRIGREKFQVWELEKREDDSAEVRMRKDSGLEPIVRQVIEYTDFPLRDIEVWLEYEGRVPVLYLPSEH